MKILRIKLIPRTTFFTPWQADTIFGHLCWAMKYIRGDDGLAEFLDPFIRGEPPFVISDGFPGDLMPMPAALRMRTRDAKESKAAKRIEWLTREDFEAARRGREVALLDKEGSARIKKGFVSSSSTHVAISRMTGAALQGQLFDLPELALDKNESFVSVYVGNLAAKTEEIEMLFDAVCRSGYGGRKSIGKGQVRYRGIEESSFSEVEGPDGYLALSSFVPAKADPTKGYYGLRVKYGKVGEGMGADNPFKKPFAQVVAGSCFFRAKEKSFYGRMTPGLAKDQRVVQYGYCLPLDVKM